MPSRYFFIIFAIMFLMSLPVYSQMTAMTAIASETTFFPAAMHVHLQHSFIGSSLILALMCFAWARALRSYSMAILALYFSVKSLWVLADGGISFVALFTANAHLLKIEHTLFSALSIMVLMAFTANLFALKKHNYYYFLWLKRLAFIIFLSIPLSYFLTQLDIALLTQVLTSLGLLPLLYIARNLPEQQSHLSLTYSVMLLVQLSFNLIAYILHFVGVDVQAINCIDMLAFWVMAIMVTYIMGRRYYSHLQDVKLAKQQVVSSAKASEIAQKKLFAVQQEGQELLESRVQERTLELNIALQELETVNQELKEKSTVDELSGLYNRRYYDQKLLAEFRRSRRNLTPLSIVLVDIDHFKQVNDNHGHLVGDKCIVETANIIKSLLRRSTDIGCRYGGEEFCLILPETDGKGALALAHEVCQSVREQGVLTNEGIINLTVSCGVTTYQQEKSVTPEIMFSSADSALYKAKQAGRNQVQVGLLNEI